MIMQSNGKPADKIISAKRILIKIGTSTITKDQKLDMGWMAKKMKEIGILHGQRKEIIIVTSGAVGAGMEVEGIHNRPKDPLGLQLLSGKGQVRLMNVYESMFKEQGIHVAQVLLTHHNFDTKPEVRNIKAVMNSYLRQGTIPIINTNDVVTNEEVSADSENKISDNDQLAALVSEFLDVDIMLLLTDVDGLCTKDPRKTQQPKLVKTVEMVTHEIEDMASAEGSMMGTGGMLSKVLAAKRVSEKGIMTIVANGAYDLQDILGNKVGMTIFLPVSRKMN